MAQLAAAETAANAAGSDATSRWRIRNGGAGSKVVRCASHPPPTDHLAEATRGAQPVPGPTDPRPWPKSARRGRSIRPRGQLRAAHQITQIEPRVPRCSGVFCEARFQALIRPTGQVLNMAICRLSNLTGPAFPIGTPGITCARKSSLRSRLGQAAGRPCWTRSGVKWRSIRASRRAWRRFSQRA
jgi:hypothetical protein